MYIIFIYKMYIYIYIHGPWLLLLSSPCVHVGSSGLSICRSTNVASLPFAAGKFNAEAKLSR